ncbi:SCO2522 family protein [Actinoplanes sp. NPDC024001]|uniref:SCO2522 family protein n=1 Tax=Actinoplanes sp. NPDC024001 TaxID=3154598 RepID=UPI00340262AB
MKADAEFFESTADSRVESVPLSHLSVELGHFYSPDLGRDADFFVDHFRRINRWYSAARDALQDTFPVRSPRISTCILIDDYFGRLESPQKLIPKLLGAAAEGGIVIDYLARESGCADWAVPIDIDPPDPGEDLPPGRSLAELVEARLVEDPPPDTTGARPPVQQTGWLCNGQRSPSTDHHEAMKRPTGWVPPAENAAMNHSIFADIELWNEGPNGRVWSCAMLAAVWQLLRFGALRDNGRRVAVPQRLPDDLPADWRELPAVSQVGERAAPFSAYRTLTVCAPLFQPIENAVRTILQQVAVEPAVLDQIQARASDEGLILAPAVVDRIEYLFVNTGPVRGVGPR